MSYYPNNYYSVNPYYNNGNNNQNVNMNQPMQQQPMQYTPQQMNMVQPQMFQPSILNGKIVDSADIVKVTEVPVGGYGVFPRADMGEVYIKTWGQDGTTQIITYKPVPPQEPQVKKEEDMNSLLLSRLSNLENKIDNILISAFGVSAANNVNTEKPVKEENNNELSTTNNTVKTSF